jgi:hypothetical protein
LAADVAALPAPVLGVEVHEVPPGHGLAAFAEFVAARRHVLETGLARLLCLKALHEARGSSSAAAATLARRRRMR